MKVYISFLALLFFVKTFAQNSESIIQVNCKCTPIAFTNSIYKNKLAYSELAESNDYRKLYQLKVIEKIGNQWINLNSYTIDNEYEYFAQNNEFKYNTIQQINNTKYFYSIIDVGYGGTAYNGLTTIIFTFYNLDQDSSPIVLYYERWSRRFSGDYILKKNNEDQLSNYKDFLKITNQYVDFLFGISSEDIDSEDNFNIKWTLNNEEIYDDLADRNLNNYDINFVEFNTVNFFNDRIVDENNTPVIENQKYKILAGFVSPVVAYDKIRNKSIVIFVPAGWPNGGGWGTRSFTLRSLNDETITFESPEYLIEVNLKSRKLKSIIKQ